MSGSVSSRVRSPSRRGCHASRGGVTLLCQPCALLPPSLPVGGQAQAGWCCWFSSAYFLVAMTTHQKVHPELLPHQMSQRQGQEVRVTRAFGRVCALGSRSRRGGTRTPITLLKAILPARDTRSAWLLVLHTADNKISS